MIKLIISFNALLFSILAFFGIQKNETPTPITAVPMCSTIPQSDLKVWTNTSLLLDFQSVNAIPSTFSADSTKAYTMPLLTQTPKGEILLSWTEKEEQGATLFCLATSKDKGKTFGEKKVIYSGAGVSNNRLMRAKVLVKKDGSMVAIFSNRADTPAANQQNGGKGRGGRSLDIMHCVSKDGGTTWTNPQSVDADPTKGIVRGFFDAVLMSNDEVAIVYLKDVANSTKHEERDLRFVTTKNGVFQPERVIDPVVCDCCNINLLVDAKGILNVYYRDNNEDIRDIAKMTSKDNGMTFSKPAIVHNDGWKISGCPHSGAVSSTHGKSALIAWFSGSDKESGVRLVTQEGKKLFVLTEESVKNPCLMAGQKQAVMLWEQNAADSKTQLVFRKINADKVSQTLSVANSTNATNATGLIIDNELLIAHEVKQANKKNSLKISTIAF